ncbi:MAG TPA: hypothetical protein VFV52_00520 [Bacilli bacterium]|nr:hypothetical protein [Bacilli bacterium]
MPRILMTPFLGYGAAYFVGQDAIKGANATGNLAATCSSRLK